MRPTSHVMCHMSPAPQQPFKSSLRRAQLRILARKIQNLILHLRHTSHVTCHTSHITCHTSHVTRHASHVTRHTSRVTHQLLLCLLFTVIFTQHDAHNRLRNVLANIAASDGWSKGWLVKGMVGQRESDEATTMTRNEFESHEATEDVSCNCDVRPTSG